MTDVSGVSKLRARRQPRSRPSILNMLPRPHRPTQPPHHVRLPRTRLARARTHHSRRSMHRRPVPSTTKLQTQARRCFRSSPAHHQTSPSQRTSSAAPTTLKKLMVLSKTTNSAIFTRRVLHHRVLARGLLCFTHDHSFLSWTWAVDISGMLFTTSNRSPPTSKRATLLKYHAQHLIR